MKKDSIKILQIDAPETDEMKEMGLGGTIHVIIHNPPQKMNSENSNKGTGPLSEN